MTNSSVTADDSRPPRLGGRRLHVSGGSAARVLGLAAALGLARAGGAAAFPLIDPTNEDQVPQGTDLAAPDAQDLRHQLQLVNGLGAPGGAGWTFVPRFDYQEMLTDNVLEQNSPRQADLVSYFSPGFTLAGNLPRITLNLSYQPTLAIYARTSSLDAITQQFNGIASVTVVPEFAFVDLRAVSGVQNAYGGVGGLGTVGATAAGASTPQTTIPTLAGNSQGLTKNNEVQTTSVGVSPYLLRDFGDWGTGKLGYSLNLSRFDTLSGFASPPIPTGGANAQTLLSNEEIAHYATGDILNYVQDAFDVDLLQNQSTADAGTIDAATGAPIPNTGNTTSTRAVVSDKITYMVDRNISVFALGGHEDIVYSGIGGESIHDLIWSLGGTWIPNPDSQLTVSYGHQNGFNSLTVAGNYALTARTGITVSYGSTLGTELENLQNQLNLATTSSNGGLVNGQTGGQLFANTNALPVQDGVFRTDTLTLGSQTVLDRDIVTFNLLLAKQTTTGGTTSTTGSSTTFTTTWIHQMRPDMTVNAAVSYAIQDQISTFGLNPGNSTSLVATLGWQWQISDTLSTSLRYSLFERHSAVVSYDLYQNMLIFGVSKTF